MTDAFQCDFCGEFSTDHPAMKLYVKDYDRAQNTEYREKYHLCGDCAEQIERSSDSSGGDA